MARRLMKTRKIRRIFTDAGLCRGFFPVFRPIESAVIIKSSVLAYIHVRATTALLYRRPGRLFALAAAYSVRGDKLFRRWSGARQKRK